MRFSICVPSVRTTSIEYTIESVRRQTFDDWELMVIGQGNDGDLRAVVEAKSKNDPRVRYMHIDPMGCSRARNAGIASSRGEIIVMTDDDCEAEPDWLEVLDRCFRDEPDIGLVSGSLIAPKPNRRSLSVCVSLVPSEALYDPAISKHRAPQGWDWIAANAAAPRHVIERVGSFDDWLGPGTEFPMADDLDYKLRLEELGIKMRSTPRAVVHHSYGRRYGLKAMLRNQRNYGLGNGGVAGKLTLLGDPRGEDWVRRTRREVVSHLRDARTSHRFVMGLRRLYYYVKAYKYCLANYEATRTPPLLSKKVTAAHPA